LENTQEVLGNHNLAAVTALIYPNDRFNKLLLTKRSNTLDLHPGEISLPGGRKEVDDYDLKQTALRELEEEVGIDCNQVEIVGELGTFITNSNFKIFAFIAKAKSELEFRINYEEVAQIIELPLDVLMDADCIRDDFWIVNGHMKFKPSFGYDGHIIFGATARILDRLVQTLCDKPYNL
tara:strand:+ start:15142 stop:15678 length:537 start_codon:yes stop_codon:yes gene_type:complete